MAREKGRATSRLVSTRDFRELRLSLPQMHITKERKKVKTNGTYREGEEALERCPEFIDLITGIIINARHTSRQEMDKIRRLTPLQTLKGRDDYAQT